MSLKYLSKAFHRFWGAERNEVQVIHSGSARKQDACVFQAVVFLQKKYTSKLRGTELHQQECSVGLSELRVDKLMGRSAP
ncbi:unnamed protein product [Mycena citricolor]|uniref:Uncharacterized protein n=1 Tax=Mycena citricolor TaxID=2018698 RepID=A0AAD2HGW4_9AGAR|nr:unnamed protein product [Mycena citricolor]